MGVSVTYHTVFCTKPSVLYSNWILALKTVSCCYRIFASLTRRRPITARLVQLLNPAPFAPLINLAPYVRVSLKVIIQEVQLNVMPAGSILTILVSAIFWEMNAMLPIRKLKICVGTKERTWLLFIILLKIPLSLVSFRELLPSRNNGYKPANRV